MLDTQGDSNGGKGEYKAHSCCIFFRHIFLFSFSCCCCLTKRINSLATVSSGADLPAPPSSMSPSPSPRYPLVQPVKVFVSACCAFSHLPFSCLVCYFVCFFLCLFACLFVSWSKRFYPGLLPRYKHMQNVIFCALIWPAGDKQPRLRSDPR